MKRLSLLFVLMAFTFNTSFAWWTNLYNIGTPWKTYYLGDYQSDVFEFGVNENTDQMTVTYGIGKSTDGSGWSWRAAEYSRKDGTNNRVWKSKINEHQFTSTGNWFYSGRFVWTASSWTEYASAAWAQSRTTLAASSYFTVSDIVDPSAQSATTGSYSDISLSWTKNAKGNNVMIVQYAHGDAPTAPTNGSSYSSGNSIGSGTVVYNGSDITTTSSSLNSSTAYDYYFYSVNNNYYSSGVFATATTATKTTDYFRSKATGNWETAASWESSYDNIFWRTATVSPDSHAANVIIENGHKLTIGYSSSASSLTIKPTGKLTINNNYSFGVTGDLIIESDATGTGTFVDKNPSVGFTIGGTSYIKQYLSAARNWYMSSPVTSTGLPSASTGTLTFYSYPENNDNQKTDGEGNPPAWIKGNYWETISSGTLAMGKGYVVRPSDVTTVTFSGSLNSGNYTINGLTNTSGNPKAGFNLVGNPHPSYLNWNSVTKTNVGNTMWYRTYTGSAYTFYTYNSIDGRGIGVPATVTNWIPPMQGFWVSVDAGTTGSIGMTNAMRDHQIDTGNSFRAPANTDRQLIRLNVSNGSISDELVIYSNSNASNGFDVYDSPKMLNGSTSAVPDIYTTAGSEKLVINGLNTLPLDVVIPVSFAANNTVATSFTISANEISNLPSGVTVKVVDNSVETSLSDGGTYTFTADAGTTKTFGLILRSPGTVTGVENGNADKFHVYANSNRQIVVNAPATTLVNVYNSIGQRITSQNMNGTSLQIDVPAAGVYLVNVGGNVYKVVAP